MNKEIAIRIRNVSKRFNDKIIFKSLNLDIEKNNITVLMAPSGYGKTTLARMICMLDNDYTGTIEIDDCDNACDMLDNKIKDEIVLMFQEDRLIENLSVFKNIELVKNDKEKILAYLRDFELATSKDKKVSKLSGGMKRRVALIKALIVQRNIIILDEPLSGLDEVIKERVINYLKKYQKEKNCTIVTILHNSNDAKKISNIIVDLEKVND